MGIQKNSVNETVLHKDEYLFVGTILRPILFYIKSIQDPPRIPEFRISRLILINFQNIQRQRIINL